MTDLELLHEYAASNSEDAFTTLVGRYVGLVHSAALRQTSDPQDTEDITQAVFVILAAKAGGLSRKTRLAGWLLRTTHFVVLNARRKQMHRRETEQRAPEVFAPETEAAWNQIAPLLDEALLQLSPGNRDAVSLRFLEQKSFKEIAEILGASEDAAQKRVARALDHLRAYFVKRGLLLPAALVAAALSTRAVEAAPAHVISHVAGAVSAGTAGTGAVPVLAKMTLATLQAARRWRLMLGGAAALLILLAGFYVIQRFAAETVSTRSNPPEAAPAEIAGGGTPAPAPPAATVPAPGRNGLRFQVVDAESGIPIANARLMVRQNAGRPASPTNVFVTAQNGECWLPVERTAAVDWSYYVEILKDGYALQFVSWSEARGDLIEDLPAEYQSKLTRSVEIGGTVLNEQSETLAGARVVFSVSGGSAPAPGPPRQREGFVIGSRYHMELCDAQGRWHCSHVPPGFGTLTFIVLHPDCVPGTFGVAESRLGATTNLPTPTLPTSYLPAETYRDGTALMILKTGFVVAGRVTDQQQKPIAGARIIEDRNWRDPWASRFSGSDGRFRFGNASAAELVLTVQADDFVAADTNVHPSARAEEVQFVLTPAAVVRGRVVNESGAPVRAGIRAAGGDFDRERFDWSATTDDAGRFEWRSVPPSQTLYRVSAPGYEVLNPVELTADGAEHLITLRPSRTSAARISGTVTDGETGRPVDDFQVWMGTTLPVQGLGGTTAFALVEPVLQTTGKAGKFSFLNRVPLVGAAGYTLEIKSDGYWPTQLNLTAPLTNDCRVEFALKRGGTLAGTVLGPEGTPAAGAVVMLCTATARAYMNVPGQLNLAVSRATHTETDANGRFSLPVKPGMKNLVVAQPAGYAQVSLEDFARTRTITLQPWGRVEGVLKVGARPGSNEMIYLSSRILPSGPTAATSLHLSTLADAAGHFVIEGVPPGEWQIAHWLESATPKAGAMPLTQGTPIEVRAGRTTSIALGGTGWKVVGRIRAGVPQPFDWRRDVCTLRLKFPDPQSLSRQYALRFDGNGAFVAEDVLPGTYELDIFSSDAFAPGTVLPRREIIVPELTPGSDAPTFDVGILDLNSNAP